MGPLFSITKMVNPLTLSLASNRLVLDFAMVKFLLGMQLFFIDENSEIVDCTKYAWALIVELVLVFCVLTP